MLWRGWNKISLIAVNTLVTPWFGLYYKYQPEEYKVVVSQEKEIIFFIISLLGQCGLT